MNYRAKTGNIVSEFTQSNWITLSYSSSPKHNSLLPKYLKHSFHFRILLGNWQVFDFIRAMERQSKFNMLARV